MQKLGNSVGSVPEVPGRNTQVRWWSRGQCVTLLHVDDLIPSLGGRNDSLEVRLPSQAIVSSPLQPHICRPSLGVIVTHWINVTEDY